MPLSTDARQKLYDFADAENVRVVSFPLPECRSVAMPLASGAVVGIDCSDSREKWLEAVEQHELPWINLLDTREGRPAETIDNLYGIGAYPTKILIDPEGRIVDIFVGERPGFSEMLDKKLKK